MNIVLIRICRFSSLCVALLLSQACFAQFEGKLFTTPEERAYLDALRSNFLRESQEQGFDITETSPPPLPAAEEEVAETAPPVEYTLGGILTRSDGSRTVWINNQPIAEASLPAGMKLIVNGTQVVLRIGTGANSFLLKPGQTVNMSTGEIVEAWQRLPALGSGDVPEPAPATDIAAPLQAGGDEEGAAESVVPEASSAEAGDREIP